MNIVEESVRASAQESVEGDVEKREGKRVENDSEKIFEKAAPTKLNFLPLNGAPDAKSFIEYPASWYPLCASSDLIAGDNKPKRFKMLGTELVAFRTKDGKAVLMNAHCSHLGVDLGGGCVVEDTLQCPYHGWKYDRSGACVEIPGQTAIPSQIKASARQTSFPVEERHGLVFFFFGARALFDLPFFFDENPNDYITGKPFQITLPCSWYMMGSHAFDEKHLELVHSRHLTAPLQIDYPHLYARRAKHSSKVAGTNIFDSLIRILAGKKVDISMTVVGGNFVVVNGDFDNIKSRFFLIGIPLESGDIDLRGVVFFRKTKSAFVNRILAPLSLTIRRWFTKGYLVNEVAELGRHTYRPQMLAEHDRCLIDYYRWAAETALQAEQNARI